MKEENSNICTCGLCVDMHDFIFVCDCNNERVQYFYLILRLLCNFSCLTDN